MTVYLGIGLSGKASIFIAISSFALEEGVFSIKMLKEVRFWLPLTKRFDESDEETFVDLCCRVLVKFVETVPGKDGSRPFRFPIEIEPIICPSQRRMN